MNKAEIKDMETILLHLYAHEYDEGGFILIVAHHSSKMNYNTTGCRVVRPSSPSTHALPPILSQVMVLIIPEIRNLCSIPLSTSAA